MNLAHSPLYEAIGHNEALRYTIPPLRIRKMRDEGAKRKDKEEMAANKHNSPFMALKHHNKVYKGIKGNIKKQQGINEADLEIMAHHAERLAAMIRAGAPKSAIVHYAAQIRHKAQRLGIMIHIPA